MVDEAPAIETMALFPLEKLPPGIRGLYYHCSDCHRRFDQEVWEGKRSYHNQDHLMATTKAALVLVEVARDGKDPLGINQIRCQYGLGWDQLVDAVAVAFVCHDLGNIAQGIMSIPDRWDSGNLELDFLDGYRAGGAEGRSIKMASRLALHLGLGPDQARLISDLIAETEFDFKDGVRSDLAIFSRVVDQIGSDLFARGEGRALGLINEKFFEDPDFQASPDFFCNFTRRRFPDLLEDPVKRDQVLAIWGKAVPLEVTRKREMVSAAALLESGLEKA